MDVVKPEYAERIASVKNAINMFGEMSQIGESYKKKEVPSNARELHLAKRDIGVLSESKRFAETQMARAKSELSQAKNAAEELVSRIKDSEAKTRARKQELEALRRHVGGEEKLPLAIVELGNHEYNEVTRELEIMKQELSKLKLGMASVLEEKAKCEEETRASHSRIKSCLKSIERLGNDIDEADEEHVLVELARIEAIKESKEIEAQREAEAASFSQKIEEAKNKIMELNKEINYAKKLETKLAITTSDLDVLQNEMVLLRAMENNFNFKPLAEEKRKNESELESINSLQSAEAELEAARKELASIKEESFRYMASMDVVRVKMHRVSTEVSRLKKMEEETDTTVQDLNSKLLRAKYKLEAASGDEKKAQAIVSNLSTALRNLQNDVAKAKREKEQTILEVENHNIETWLNDSSIDMAKEQLEAAMQELEAVKASETAALNMLRTLSDKTMRCRDSFARHKSTITIPNFEYQYLRSCAEGAQEIANKKVEAAHAWVQAFNVSEEDILLQTKIIEREIIEIKELEEKELRKRSVVGSKEKRGKRKSQESAVADMQLVLVPARKSFKDKVTVASSRKSRIHRRSITSMSQISTRAPSVTLQRRRKVMVNLVKFLRGRKTARRKSGI